MPTQLEFPLDFPDAMPDKFPPVDNITVPFTWERVDYLMGIPSVDFVDGLSIEYNRQNKRSDRGYEDLVEDLMDQGFLDPIFVHPPGHRIAFYNTSEHLGNGHHRLLAAHEIGWTHVPVTRDDAHQWRNSGTSAQ